MVWQSGPIELPYTEDSLLQLLKEGERGTQSQFSHWDIVKWCQQFTNHWENCCSAHPVYSIADDVIVQWELYLARQYTLEQMQRFNQSDLLLARDLFNQWARSLESLTQ